MLDEEKVKKRLRKEKTGGYYDTEYIKDVKEIVVNAEWNCIKMYHPKLHPIIEKWANGEEPDFEVNGMPIKKYMQRQGISYIHALGDMDEFLKNPDKLVEYIKLGEPLLYEYDYEYDDIIF